MFQNTMQLIVRQKSLRLSDVKSKGLPSFDPTIRPGSDRNPGIWERIDQISALFIFGVLVDIWLFIRYTRQYVLVSPVLVDNISSNHMLPYKILFIGYPAETYLFRFLLVVIRPSKDTDTICAVGYSIS